MVITTHLADAATHVCLDCSWRDPRPEAGNETAHIAAFPRHRVMVSLVKLALVHTKPEQPTEGTA